MREPIIIANILVPPDHVGAVMQLCIEKRGVQKKMLYLGTPGVARNTSCRSPKSCSTSSIG